MAVEGYSQGGGAVGWVAQQKTTYAPSLNLVGVAGGGTPANLQAVKNNIDGSAFFAFLAGTAIGFRAAYPSLNVNQYLSLYGSLAISALNGMCQLPALALYAFHHLTEYTKNNEDPTLTSAFAAALTANNLGATKPAVPVLQYHGANDEVIPYAVAQTDVVNWIANRFAGQAAPSNC
jgi:pimeloyl-ACP methyl ester carboxylesterase